MHLFNVELWGSLSYLSANREGNILLLVTQHPFNESK